MNGKKQVTKMEQPVLAILTDKEAKRIPIWLMRQAGRYLPEYRTLRKETKNFLDLCLTPQLAAEITLQPVRRFDFDAAILFADILLIPHALGQKLEFHEGKGPVLDRLKEKKSLTGLCFNHEKLAPVFKTLQIVKKELPPHTALIGFCGGLWTVAAYMIDGTSRDNFSRAKSWTAKKPELLDQLIGILLDASADYLCRQAEAGADALQIFESWAGLLPDDTFDRWIIGPTRELVARVKRKYPQIPVIGFPRDAGSRYRDYIAKTGIDAVSIDQQVPLAYARENLQPVKPLQGNLDPLLLVKGGDDMRRAAENIMKKLGPRHIFNLGHGVLPETPLDHVSELIEIVRGFKVTA
jgi:uroporphyrinogen decarboxylase